MNVDRRGFVGALLATPALARLLESSRPYNPEELVGVFGWNGEGPVVVTYSAVSAQHPDSRYLVQQLLHGGRSECVVIQNEETGLFWNGHDWQRRPVDVPGIPTSGPADGWYAGCCITEHPDSRFPFPAPLSTLRPQGA